MNRTCPHLFPVCNGNTKYHASTLHAATQPPSTRQPGEFIFARRPASGCLVPSGAWVWRGAETRHSTLYILGVCWGYAGWIRAVYCILDTLHAPPLTVSTSQLTYHRSWRNVSTNIRTFRFGTVNYYDYYDLVSGS